MSKRKSRNKTPNLPKATLERAREQAGLPPEADDIEEADVPEAVSSPAAPVASSPAAAKPAAARSSKAANGGTNGPRRKPRLTAAQLERSKQRGEVDHELTEYLLENPTKVVTEEQMHDEYSFVLKDLRNMFALAAVLIVIMIGLVSIF